MMNSLTKIRLRGWKSIREAELTLSPLNVLIGANGSGKSNFISYFKLLNEMSGERLQEYIGRANGAETLLYYGSKQTPFVEAELHFITDSGVSAYYQRLAYAAIDTLIFTDEKLTFHRPGYPKPKEEPLGAGHKETKLRGLEFFDNDTVRVLRRLVSSCRVFHFHDTSAEAAVRKPTYIEENKYLHADGET